jgi:hypothetical protein
MTPAKLPGRPDDDVVFIIESTMSEGDSSYRRLLTMVMRTLIGHGDIGRIKYEGHGYIEIHQVGT